MPVPIAPAARLRADLDRLADEVEAVRTAYPDDAAPERRHTRDALATLIRGYLIPRLGHPESPLVVAVFGPTGSGKSTLVNSLAGHAVSVPGPLRPTTRRAVVWTKAIDDWPTTAGVFSEAEVVPDAHPLLDGLVVVDTPDVDSVMVEHRVTTERVLRHADAGIFVTTAQRYADAVPWELLREMARRGLPLLYVMNRSSRRSTGAVADFSGLLKASGLDPGGSDAVVTIQEQRLRGEGRIPSGSIRRVVEFLEDLATRHDSIVTTTTQGAIGVALADAARVSAGVGAERDAAGTLWNVVEQAYRRQVEEVQVELERGSLIRDEVLARWQRLIGVGDLAAVVARGASWLSVIFRGRRLGSGEDEIEREARSELAAVIAYRAGRAAGATAAAWELDGAGRSLLDTDLRLAAPDLQDTAQEVVDRWMADLVALVRDEGGSRFRLARYASVGVNAVASVLLLTVFAHTGGLTGAELGITAGAAAAQQSVLEHLFGSAVAGRLTTQARKRLISAVEEQLMADAARFRVRLDSALDRPGLESEILGAIQTVELESERFYDR